MAVDYSPSTESSRDYGIIRTAIHVVNNRHTYVLVCSAAAREYPVRLADLIFSPSSRGIFQVTFIALNDITTAVGRRLSEIRALYVEYLSL